MSISLLLEHYSLTLLVCCLGLITLPACKSAGDPQQEPAYAIEEKTQTFNQDYALLCRRHAAGVDLDKLLFFATSPVAHIDGEPLIEECYNRDVDKLMRLTGGNGNIPPKMAQFYKKQMLERVVDEYLLDAEVKKKKITISDEELQKEYDKFVARFPSKEQFEMYFERSGMSEEELREDLRKRLSHERLLADISVSDADIEAFYNENIERFKEEEQVKARHILFKLPKSADAQEVHAAEQKAYNIIAQARLPGADFGDLAKQYSEGPSGPRGGDLGTFPRKRMVKAFSDAAFALEPGDISEPVRTEFGFHIIKVEEKTDARIKPLEEVKDMIEYNLSSKKVREGMDALLADLKKTYEVVIHPDAVKLR